MANRTKFTSKRREKFFSALAETANVTKAAELIGISRMRLYALRAEDEAFKAEWDAAVERGTDALEDEATRRALEGWDEPVFYQGVATGIVRKYSDTLLIFQLKARRPEKYRERISTELTGKGGGPVIIQATPLDEAL